MSPRRTLVEEGVARTGLYHAGLDDERVHRLDLDSGTGDELVRRGRRSSGLRLRWGDGPELAPGGEPARVGLLVVALVRVAC